MEANVGRHTRRMARGVGVVDPTYEKCGPSDTACVARNAAVGATFGSSQLNEWLAARLASCIALGSDPAGCHAEFDPGGSYAATANAGQPVQGYVAQQTPVGVTVVGIQGGQFIFTPSRGGALYPGDTWNITIRGASPNLQVSSRGIMPGNKSYYTPFGVTDANGNFTLSGTINSGDVGSWQEDWYVSSVKSGSLSFTVLPTPATVTVTQSSQTTPQASGAQTGNVTNTNQVSSPATNQTVFGLFGDTSPVLFGVVNEYTALGIAAALVVGFMMVKGGR